MVPCRQVPLSVLPKRNADPVRRSQALMMTSSPSRATSVMCASVMWVVIAASNAWIELVVLERGPPSARTALGALRTPAVRVVAAALARRRGENHLAMMDFHRPRRRMAVRASSKASKLRSV